MAARICRSEARSRRIAREATPAAGLSLEAVDAGLATDADLARQDLKGKAVFFYSNDYMSRHATASNGAWKRISEKGAAAIFITLMIPGNLRFQFYPVQSPVPTFSLGLEDGLARARHDRAIVERSGAAGEPAPRREDDAGPSDRHHLGLAAGHRRREHHGGRASRRLVRGGQ